MFECLNILKTSLGALLSGEFKCVGSLRVLINHPFTSTGS